VNVLIYLLNAKCSFEKWLLGITKCLAVYNGQETQVGGQELAVDPVVRGRPTRRARL
jgi:hypothetical protein